ncbi:MAG TPA: hypothetical protein VHZ49_01950 [Methylomirabilota bacterium]|jgi:hypothetical protein|nr:hypothetical protein [Methylomirabilota bacterium]
MRSLLALAAAALVTLAASSAGAQVKLETTRPSTEQKPPEARIIPPPLHYEQTRPRDADFYPYGTRVEHDPAFIEPFAGSYETASGSGRYGLSGWTAPNPPIGSEATLWRQTNGWFALGFSVTWDGPPARSAPAQRPPR